MIMPREAQVLKVGPAQWFLRMQALNLEFV